MAYAWEAKFLAALSKTGIVSKAAAAARISRSRAYEVRDEDATFAAAWDSALQDAADLLEAEAWRRATKGTKRPVYQGGEHVGDVQEYSDTLLIFLLKGARPGKYRDNARVEHTGAGGGPITISEVIISMPPDEDSEEISDDTVPA